VCLKRLKFISPTALHTVQSPLVSGGDTEATIVGHLLSTSHSRSECAQSGFHCNGGQLTSSTPKFQIHANSMNYIQHNTGMCSSESVLSTLNKSTFTTADLCTKSGSWQIAVFSFELHYTLCVLGVDKDRNN